MVYNLLKRHPTCMQIIHRPDSLPGRADPFDPLQTDPLQTGALESSLWELAVHIPPEVSDFLVSNKPSQSKCVITCEDLVGAIYETELQYGGFLGS